jgi:two-component system, NarL family, nitrate/nitrite response regulator NarL
LKWEVCGEAANGQEALQKVVELLPDVVILDLSMPVMNGFDVTREIRRLAPGTKIVLFSIHDVPATATQIGADAFVAKSSDIEVLMSTLDRLLPRNTHTAR